MIIQFAEKFWISNLFPEKQVFFIGIGYRKNWQKKTEHQYSVQSFY